MRRASPSFQPTAHAHSEHRVHLQTPLEKISRTDYGIRRKTERKIWLYWLHRRYPAEPERNGNRLGKTDIDVNVPKRKESRMKNGRILLAATLLLLWASHSFAWFIPEFEPVWERQKKKPPAPSPYAPSTPYTPSPTPYSGGNEWVDPVTGMKFAWVPKGCYQMGCGNWTSDCSSDEKPVHDVCLDGFWIGKYEVTQDQWEKVMGNNPSYFKKGRDYPVEKVSWDDVQQFIAKLNSKSSGVSFRLPTEAEWE